jgi:hypothetical protein
MHQDNYAAINTPAEDVEVLLPRRHIQQFLFYDVGLYLSYDTA